MAEGCEGGITLEVVENLPGLPFSRSLARFRKHYKSCEPCGTATKEDPENCQAYCHYGHDLLHEVQSDMDFTHVTSHMN